jgi:hypothetical protein
MFAFFNAGDVLNSGIGIRDRPSIDNRAIRVAVAQKMRSLSQYMGSGG